MDEKLERVPGRHMREHRKKMIAPIVVTILVILYYLFIFGIVVNSTECTAMKAVLGVVPFLLAAAMIAVCVQRIREIKGGEEDDLGKY